MFFQASAFNQDVSKWDTGAVTNMGASKCTLSLSLSVVTPSAVVYFEYTTTRISSDHNSHQFCYFCCCVIETVPFCFCLRWVGFFFFVVAPSLAVFGAAIKFNRDTSKWNTGAVTTMQQSKSTLPLSVATPSAVVYFEYTTTRVSSDHNSHTFCFFSFKCSNTAGSNEHCAVANGYLCLQTII